MDKPLCLCFPCLLFYLDEYVYPKSEDQFYPVLQRKGFSDSDQRAIAEEWYWVAIERETAVKDYLGGYVTFHDGCYWRPPPRQSQQRSPRRAAPEEPRRTYPELLRRRSSSTASTRASSSSGPSA